MHIVIIIVPIYVIGYHDIILQPKQKHYQELHHVVCPLCSSISPSIFKHKSHLGVNSTVLPTWAWSCLGNEQCEHSTNENPSVLLRWKPCPKSHRFIEKYYRPSRYTFGIKKNYRWSKFRPWFLWWESFKIIFKDRFLRFQGLFGFLFFVLDKFHWIKL